MSYEGKLRNTLNAKDFARFLNLGTYISLIAVSGLVMGATPLLGNASVLLFSSFMLALFYSIDNQLLNFTFMPEQNVHSINNTDTTVVCDIMDKQVIQDTTDLSIEQEETLDRVA